MAVIKVCNYYISTNYKKSEAKEKFEEALTAFVENMDPDINFELRLFVEDLTEDSQDFELLSDIDADDAEIEYNEEELDEYVDDILSEYIDEDVIEVGFDDEDFED